MGVCFDDVYLSYENCCTDLDDTGAVSTQIVSVSMTGWINIVYFLSRYDVAGIVTGLLAGNAAGICYS